MLLLSFPFLLMSLAVNEKHCQVPILLLKGSVLCFYSFESFISGGRPQIVISTRAWPYLCYLLNVLAF